MDLSLHVRPSTGHWDQVGRDPFTPQVRQHVKNRNISFATLAVFSRFSQLPNRHDFPFIPTEARNRVKPGFRFLAIASIGSRTHIAPETRSSSAGPIAATHAGS